jgi:hypothetical protein
MDYVELLKQFGFPVAAAIIVGYAYWKATSDRIKKLESITTKQGATIEELQEDRLRRAEGYAHVLREIALKIGGALKEQSAATKEQSTVMREQHTILREAVRAFQTQCQGKRTPSSPEIPAAQPRNEKEHTTDLFPHTDSTPS